MRKRCTRCVGYLPERSRQACYKNSRVNLHKHETKFCICSAWFLVHLTPHGTKERCVGDGVIVHCSLDVYFLPCRMLVDNKQSRNVLKNFEMIFLFFFEICCSHPKINFKDVKSMDPKMLAVVLFYLFFRERFF